MKILHLAAGNRWTGAAAPAFAEVEALREAGIDAHYAYVGGYKLQAKLARHDFAHPIIEKAQNPLSFSRTIRAIDRLVTAHGFDFIHAHLTYDHWLARFVARGRRGVRLARTFHSRRTLRNEPLTRSLIAHTRAIFVINQEMTKARLLRPRQVTFTPPPLDTDQFSLDGWNARGTYGLAPDTPVVAAIGKLSKNRGFEAVLQAFTIVQRSVTNARLLIIGHGEHRGTLAEMAGSLGIDVIWAGYHEDDLAQHYRAADVLLFTTAGSDEGHRAVIEAMGCGVSPATYPIEGMDAILGDLAPTHRARSADPALLAEIAMNLLRAEGPRARVEVNRRAQVFGFASAAERLIDVYSTPR
ncbi:MAG TPA: glycosyltransferase family 4 protein [Thermoanaerobaculia bacterium]|nr:glycosyltransferase family 4 protein [Thermoanaerobaculia bacterium]